MSLRSRLASILPGRSGTDDGAADGEQADRVEPRPLEEVAIVLPVDAPETCPNCGAPIDDAVPPDLDDPVQIGDHSRVCHIGTRDASSFAGWRIVHR